MTKEEFMHAANISDEEELENMLLLTDYSEPENGDWIEVMAGLYHDMCECAREFTDKYIRLKMLLENGQRDTKLRLIEGEFYEGQYVTVELIETGKQYRRLVKYSRDKWADLYVTINGKDYTFSEVE